MKIKAIITRTFAISALGVSGVASANAYDFGTKDTCQVVSCGGQASGYIIPVPSGAGAQDFAMTDLTPVKVEPIESTEIAAMETGSGNGHSTSSQVPEGSTLYDWARLQ
ncbi:MAG: hypothetical protein LJE91_10730 [Gammaproteobacteria bacterium]|jgi:hypothetical protein|nr:hypothetical protein [Gammaproteobacteria bacterium]